MSRITQKKKLVKNAAKGLFPLKWHFFKKEESKLTQVFGRETARKLLNQVENLGLQGLFQNSFRFYEEGNTLQKQEFDRIEENTCDGLFFQTFNIDGKNITVAYNYEY